MLVAGELLKEDGFFGEHDDADVQQNISIKRSLPVFKPILTLFRLTVSISVNWIQSFQMALMPSQFLLMHPSQLMPQQHNSSLIVYASSRTAMS